MSTKTDDKKPAAPPVTPASQAGAALAPGPVTPGQELAPQAQGTTAVAVFEDYGTDAGAGMEDVKRDEYKIPFLRILQALSPACQPPEAGGIEGARPGQIINTTTGEITDAKKTRIIFIPCYRDHNYVEFPPRLGGGTGTGFQGAHDPESPDIAAMRAKQGKFVRLVADNGNELIETRYLYGIAIVGDNAPFPCIVGFSGSQLKKYQQFVGVQMGIQFKVAGTDGKPGYLVKPPLWAVQWQISTVFEKGKKGDYYNWQLQLANNDADNRPSAFASLIKKFDPLYEQGANFYKMIKEGNAAVDYGVVGPDAETEASTPGGDTTPPQGGQPLTDEEIPF